MGIVEADPRSRLAKAQKKKRILGGQKTGLLLMMRKDGR